MTWAISSARAAVEAWTDNVRWRQKDLDEAKDHLARVEANLAKLLERDAA